VVRLLRVHLGRFDLNGVSRLLPTTQQTFSTTILFSQQQPKAMAVSARGFDVSVESIGDDTPWPVYAVTRRGAVTYATIEARDAESFKVRVRPQNPFPVPKDSARTHKRVFDYYASIYINGDRREEDSLLIEPNPRHKDWKLGGGVFWGRRCRPQNPQASGHSSKTAFEIFPWTFKDQTIDVLLSEIDLSKTTNVGPPQDDEVAQLADNINALPTKNNTPNNQKGTIEVEIARYITSGLSLEHNENVIWERGEQIQKPNEDRTETTISLDSYGGVSDSSEFFLVRPYDKDEEAFAKVIFRYFPITKLMALGLANRDGTPVTRQNRRRPTTNQASSVVKHARTESSASEASASCDSDSESDSDAPRRKSNAKGSRPTKKQSKLQHEWRSTQTTAQKVTAQQALAALPGSEFEMSIAGADKMNHTAAIDLAETILPSIEEDDQIE
jgi:hypothetical protein